MLKTLHIDLNETENKRVFNMAQFLTLDILRTLASLAEERGQEEGCSPIIQVYDEATGTYRPVKIGAVASEHVAHLERIGKGDSVENALDEIASCDLILTI